MGRSRDFTQFFLLLLLIIIIIIIFFFGGGGGWGGQGFRVLVGSLWENWGPKSRPHVRGLLGHPWKGLLNRRGA